MSISTGRVAENRRARHDYQIEETLEAGIILQGSEVKSLRTGRASIAESYAGEDQGRLALFNANIPVYPASRDNHAPKRVRELLVSKKERNRLLGLIRREGVTLVRYRSRFISMIAALPSCRLGWRKARRKLINARLSATETGPVRNRDCCADAR